MMRNETAPKHIGLMGPFGFGNLGDAAIQQAMIQHIQETFPDAVITGFSLNPEDTERRHHIKTYPIGRMASFGWAGKTRGSSFFQRAHEWAIQFRANPNRIISLFGRAFLGFPLEVISFLEASKWIKDMDAFIVSGGGQLDDYWGGAWHHPYTLLFWALLSKLRGIKFFVVSVGAGPLNSSLSRLFVRITLRMAEYRSYRDQKSKEFVNRIGFKNNDPVYPDLAHSLFVDTLKNVSSNGHFKGIVGIGPMAYFDPRVWPEKDEMIYQNYLEKIADISSWLIDNNFEILFFPGEAVHDIPVIDEIVQKIQNVCKDIKPGQINVPTIETLDELMKQLAKTDVIIASRFHGVLLSQLIHKPVLALSYHPKIDALMKETDMPEYCFQIKDFDCGVIKENFLHLWSNKDLLEETLKCKEEQYRSDLNEQFDVIFKAL